MTDAGRQLNVEVLYNIVQTDTYDHQYACTYRKRLLLDA